MSTLTSYGDKMEYQIALLSASCFLIFIWEHIGRKKGCSKRPSTILHILVIICRHLFEQIGLIFAKLSSFYVLIDWYDFLVTLFSILEPMIQLVLTPYHMIIGYIKGVKLFHNPTLIYVGSATIAVALVAIIVVITATATATATTELTNPTHWVNFFYIW